MDGYTFLGLIIGSIIGYSVFYFRYKHKDTINHLRSNLKEVNKELQYIQDDLEEYKQQNEILKEEAIKLLEKNDDLTEVVTELSKYYVHIKKAAEKSTELSKFLQEPKEEIVEKIEIFNSKNKTTKEEKTFF